VQLLQGFLRQGKPATKISQAAILITYSNAGSILHHECQELPFDLPHVWTGGYMGLTYPGKSTTCI
jgi:hypothetical protein